MSSDKHYESVEKRLDEVTPEQLKHVANLIHGIMVEGKEGIVFIMQTQKMSEGRRDMADAAGVAYLGKMSKAKALETMMESLHLHPITPVKVAAEYAERHAAHIEINGIMESL